MNRRTVTRICAGCGATWTGPRCYALCPPCREKAAAERATREDAEIARHEQFGGVDAPSWWFPGCGE